MLPALLRLEQGFSNKGWRADPPPAEMLQGVCIPRDQVPVGPQFPSSWPLVERVGQVPHRSVL